MKKDSKERPNAPTESNLKYETEKYLSVEEIQRRQKELKETTGLLFGSTVNQQRVHFTKEMKEKNCDMIQLEIERLKVIKNKCFLYIVLLLFAAFSLMFVMNYILKNGDNKFRPKNQPDIKENILTINYFKDFLSSKEFPHFPSVWSNIFYEIEICHEKSFDSSTLVTTINIVYDNLKGYWIDFFNYLMEGLRCYLATYFTGLETKRISYTVLPIIMYFFSAISILISTLSLKGYPEEKISSEKKSNENPMMKEKGYSSEVYSILFSNYQAKILTKVKFRCTMAKTISSILLVLLTYRAAEIMKNYKNHLSQYTSQVADSGIDPGEHEYGLSGLLHYDYGWGMFTLIASGISITIGISVQTLNNSLSKDFNYFFKLAKVKKKDLKHI